MGQYTYILLLCICGVALCFTTESLVVSSTAAPSKEAKEDAPEQEESEPIVPKIYELRVDTNVSNRFATTLVTNKVRNLAKTAQEATFSVVLPETAYISKFVMIINDKSYEAYVKGVEEARQTYQKAVESGQAAAHVEASARDSNRFTVSVNVEPQTKATFKLTYEELLQRRNERYEIVLNIHPGQPVENLNIEVKIAESRPLKFVKTPSLRSGNEISKNDEALDPQAEITDINSTAAVVKFTPNVEQQKHLAKGLGTKEESGLSGQFIVQYDVERDSEGGEILVKDGYFVHFFAPSQLKPLPKHVVFILDTSGSMSGIRIQQLKEAMRSILTELKQEDVFNIVEFGWTVKVWGIEEGEVRYQQGEDQELYYTPEERTTSKPSRLTLPPATAVNENNLKKAKDVVEKLHATGLTDIKSALEVGLQLVRNNKENQNNTHQPLIIFLTDGEPTVGEVDTERIISSVHEFNSGPSKSPIFSLSFGDGADREFLQKLSLKNFGFTRHIYEAADASLQLQEFYRQISSPLLSNVTFKYVSNVTKLTKTVFPIFFYGSELCVAGHTDDIIIDPGFAPSVTGRGNFGPINLVPTVVNNPVGALERLWAYLTVKQILEARDAADNKTELTKKALDLALKYSFVTPVTSLVVVKPNDTSAVGTQDASQSASGNDGVHSKLLSSGGLPGSTRLVYSSRVPVPNSLPGLPRPLPYPIHGVPPPTRYFDIAGPSPYPQPQSGGFHNRPTSTLVDDVDQDGLPELTSNEYDDLKRVLPWLSNILSENGTLTTPPGNLKLGLPEDLTGTENCSETPVNGTSGICTALSACPQVHSLLTDEKVFTKYVCTVNKIAGICCPKQQPLP